ncbi:helix-turn-helix domain-containing protein [Anaerocolumna sedimenticola]|uniref:Helix-turn-helix domain-containing protein n=1 Tax=Anaerocolumna sedimenticola TaxID=2696063 RepID=A0A6P1THH8_9FIRM|nr:helix-turn-helix transcriptional regulator [Anaerocolumna sedimenticola]QHQ59386.1 helix-turn-helix domain-containing protein [Anaerocolumna sedimenticola]
MKQNGKRILKLFKKSKEHTILYQFMVTYFIVLFIPLFICSGYYVRMISVIGHDDVQTRKAELKHAAVLVDTMLDEFSYLGDSLASNSGVNSFNRISTAFDGSNSYKVYELHAMLPDLYQINQSIFDYFIYFDKSETVVNRQIAYTYKDFYDLYLHEEKYKSYDDWYRHVKEDKVVYGLSPIEAYLYKDDTSLNMIAYTRPMIYGDYNGKSKIQILFKDTVLETLMPTRADNSIQFIKDFQGRMLYYKAQGEPEEMAEGDVSSAVDTVITNLKNPENQTVLLEKEKYLVIRYTSDKSGLEYYMLQPMVAVNSRSMYSIFVLAVFIFAAVTVGIVLSYYMSKKSATPINDIMKEVSQSTERFKGHQAVFLSLKETFNHLVNTNTNMVRVIESQKPFLRNAFFNRLLYGNFTTEEDASMIAENIGLPHIDRVFGILIFRFNTEIDKIVEDDLKLINSCILSLIEVMKEILPDSLYTNLDGDQVVLLMSIDKKHRESFREEAEQKIIRIKEAMPSNVSDQFFVYGGSEVESLTELKDSYNNAVYMFQNEKGQIDNIVIWYINNFVNIPSYPPQDFSLKLMHYVMAGDNEGLHDALEEIIKKYFIENNLPVYLQHMLLNELQTVLFRIIRRIGADESEYRNYYNKLEENSNATLLSQITITLNLYQAVCKGVVDKKKLKDTSAITASIASYIDINYGDKNLSLTSVADIFSISEPYLSSIFKQSLGINFSTYMEGIRIDKAKELLEKTNLSIGEISDHVGYGSANSFCRAFKRVTGISASEYRKK